MPKQKKLPERPKPPTMQEIHEDIDMAPNDDVVFAVHDSENCKIYWLCTFTRETFSLGESLSDPNPQTADIKRGIRAENLGLVKPQSHFPRLAPWLVLAPTLKPVSVRVN